MSTHKPASSPPRVFVAEGLGAAAFLRRFTGVTQVAEVKSIEPETLQLLPEIAGDLAAPSAIALDRPFGTHERALLDAAVDPFLDEDAHGLIELRRALANRWIELRRLTFELAPTGWLLDTTVHAVAETRAPTTVRRLHVRGPQAPDADVSGLVIAHGAALSRWLRPRGCVLQWVTVRKAADVPVAMSAIRGRLDDGRPALLSVHEEAGIAPGSAAADAFGALARSHEYAWFGPV